MTKVIIDGIEYIPATEVSRPTPKQLLECLRELVSIQLFHEDKHKHRAQAWDALNAISPSLAELTSKDPALAFEIIHTQASVPDNECEFVRSVRELANNFPVAESDQLDASEYYSGKSDALAEVMELMERYLV